MNLGEKDIKKLTMIVLVALLLVLVYVVVKPVILATIGGLILVYVFAPLYNFVKKYIKNKTVAAFIIVVIILATLSLLIWLIIPLMMKQVFDIFDFSQNIEVQRFIKSIFPNSNEQFIGQLSLSINGFISKASSSILNSLLSIFLELPKILLNFFILGFVFFFGLRDHEKFTVFLKGISPFGEIKEKIIIKHFKDMTDSVIYGQIFVGIVQGSLAGLGLFIFGVENSLVLTILAIFLSIIPFVGPALVWIPVSVYLFVNGNTSIALGFLAYNLFFVSVADNFLRTYLIARRTDISPAVIMVGMIGGIFVFGILGLILGPLILAYLLTLLESFKDNSVYSLFSDNK